MHGFVYSTLSFFVFQVYTEFYWCLLFAVVILLQFCKHALSITICSNVIRAGKIHFENVTFDEPRAQSFSWHLGYLSYTCHKRHYEVYWQTLI